MSAAQVQHVVLRMLHDPDFTQAVYDMPEKTLAGLDLSPNERAWLIAPDRRAWSIDPLRRTRCFQGLLEEYPASSALYLDAGGTLPQLEAYFSCPDGFHAAVMAEASLALSYGTWTIERLREGAPMAAAVAELERGVAALRRAQNIDPPTLSPGSVGLSQQSHCVRCPEGSLVQYQAVMTTLTDHPAGPLAALTQTTLRLPFHAQPSASSEYLLLEHQGDDDSIAITVASLELWTLLSHASGGALRSALERRAQNLGCTPTEAVELLDELASEGLLVNPSSP